MPIHTGSGGGSASTAEQTLVLAAAGQAGDSLTITTDAVIEVKKQTAVDTYVNSDGTVNVSYDDSGSNRVATVENLINASVTYLVSYLV